MYYAVTTIRKTIKIIIIAQLKLHLFKKNGIMNSKTNDYYISMEAYLQSMEAYLQFIQLLHYCFV